MGQLINFVLSEYIKKYHFLIFKMLKDYERLSHNILNTSVQYEIIIMVCY